jgi:hypothetical protein
MAIAAYALKLVTDIPGIIRHWPSFILRRYLVVLWSAGGEARYLLRITSANHAGSPFATVIPDDKPFYAAILFFDVLGGQSLPSGHKVTKREPMLPAQWREHNPSAAVPIHSMAPVGEAFTVACHTPYTVIEVNEELFLVVFGHIKNLL